MVRILAPILLGTGDFVSVEDLHGLSNGEAVILARRIFFEEVDLKERIKMYKCLANVSILVSLSRLFFFFFHPLQIKYFVL